MDVSAEVRPCVRHVPPTEKQPAVKFRPFANVDDAVVDVTFRRFVAIPPVYVVVPVLVNVCSPVNVLFVYVFGMVVDACMNDCTRESR